MPSRKSSSLRKPETPPTPAPQPISVPDAKGRVFLIDTMSFIFRAYHAMARQRPMSTNTGLPTAAILVFVNMLRKLRDDFYPEYLAAVFDVGGTHLPRSGSRSRHHCPAIRSQDPDLPGNPVPRLQSQPHGDAAMTSSSRCPTSAARSRPIAFRSSSMHGFEADDVIGTLARKAAAAGYHVYVVSSDKDMMQLVNDSVRVLNPPKDNLICDAAKVEEILGVPPERVVDVMALRGDSIDNIPGAPGIGDKGSVELIKRFGTVEAALDHAAEVESKTYRESLLNNREIVLFSKRMATIDTNVPIELDLDAMKCGRARHRRLRALSPNSNSPRC